MDEGVSQARELRHLTVGFKVRLPLGRPARYTEEWLYREGSKLVSVALRDDMFQVRTGVQWPQIC